MFIFLYIINGFFIFKPNFYHVFCGVRGEIFWQYLLYKQSLHWLEFEILSHINLSDSGLGFGLNLKVNDIHNFSFK